MTWGSKFYLPEFDVYATAEEAQALLERKLAEERGRAKQETLDRRPVLMGRFSELEERVDALERRISELTRKA